MSIELGRFNRLAIVKEVEFGLYLDGGDEGEILLPKRYVPAEWQIGDELDVFIYLDNEERLVATTQKPLVQVGQFACLKVSWVNQYGAFLDWGLMKDLFCPFREQRQKMEVGKSYVIHAHVDENSFRIMASAKVERYLSDSLPEYGPGDQVGLLVWQRTDLGYKVIVDNQYSGLVFHNQIFKPIKMGDRLTGYVSKVRADGKIDIMLQPTGRQQTVEFSELLLNYLKSHGGHCSLSDKSPAEDIYAAFGVSKKVYKKALGDLYKRRVVRLDQGEVNLV